MGPLVEDPIRRQRYRFSREGEVLRAQVWADPGADVPTHLHPHQEERFEVIEGEVEFTVDGERRRAGPGDHLVAPAGSWHSFRNRGGKEAQLAVEVEPALELQGFLEEAAALARAGKYTRRGVPRSAAAALELAALIDRYREVTVMRFPPPWVQQALLAPLARLGRRRAAARLER